MPRKLSEQERSLLLHLTEGKPDVAVLRAQIDAAEYVEPWFEGSQSFEIRVSPSAPGYDAGQHMGEGRQIVAEADVFKGGVRSDQSYIGGLIVWANDGLLSALEYYWVREDMPTSLPPLDEVLT